LLKTSPELSSGRNMIRSGSGALFAGLDLNHAAFKDDATVALFSEVNWKGYYYYYYYYYLLTAIGLMPGGSVYKNDIYSTRNIAHTSHGKTTRTSFKFHNTVQVQWPNTSTVNKTST
jgi:hypothetical protein